MESDYEVLTLENYVVLVDPEREINLPTLTVLGAYSVVNRETGVEEYVSFQLPDALANAHQLNKLMIAKPWEFDPTEDLTGNIEVVH